MAGLDGDEVDVESVGKWGGLLGCVEGITGVLFGLVGKVVG